MKFLIALIALSCACHSALAQVGKLVHKEEKRKYIVYTPASYQSEPRQSYPLVFNFHGGGMSMTEQMLYSQMNRTADRHGFIVVYPQGIKQDWNVGFDMPYLEGTDDVGFTQALLAKLKQDYRIDGSRVYATGLSRGGFFALRLAADLPDVFAAVASVEIVAGLVSVPVRSRTIDPDKGDGTDVTYLEQADGERGVALVTVRDGGHTWPGADPFNIGLPIGKTTRDVDANELMWQFFSRHRRSP